MSSVTKNLPYVRRHPEAMYVRFADLPYEVSLEVADNFIVDFSPDNDIVGLEVLWDDTDRSGSEPALLAYGVFAAALVWLGLRHNKYSAAYLRQTLLRKIERFISAVELPLQVVSSGDSGLIVSEQSGGALLCADLQHYRGSILWAADGSQREPSALSEQLHIERERLRSSIDQLSQTIQSECPGAIGVGAFVDPYGLLRHREAISPGRWVTWPDAPSNSWVHIAIIPPHDRVYPWLSDGFISI